MSAHRLPRRRVFTAAGLTLVVILLAAPQSGCRLFRSDKQKEADPIGTPELRGLRSDILTLTRTGPGVEIEYRLSRAAPLQGWLLNPAEPVLVRFWNPDDRIVGAAEQSSMIALDPGFLDGSVSATTALVAASVPANATKVSLALGRSGLETERREL